ncbi:MAG TPA: aminotransferase class I/II-fold pyridoxal phosphate-dependent enzyme [Hyphomicrobiaceae bacterium]|nr:aminotransferase class I/II-fold pyridoxal phosphate-dependent enzyme [Hyphomicrobiaceae bacterium]
MTASRLKRRAWVPAHSEDYIQAMAGRVADADGASVEALLDAAVQQNADIHERDCLNLNPATNALNPKAERLLSAKLGARPSLGYPGDKYEMGLEGVEKIEIICAELAAEVFNADFAEIRIGSGALANLYAFMATTEPGDTILVPPAEIGGHVTHHAAGAAGLYGLKSVPMPVDAKNFTVDLEGVARLAREHKPKLMTIGGSLNLFPHPVADLKKIASGVGAKLLYDAAHMSGMIAGKAWQQPLAEGADMMTMSTYKSLAGPPAGLLLTNDAELAKRVDAIAYPGLTANFDVAKSAALAITLLDWRDHGADYGRAMLAAARSLALALAERGLPVHAAGRGGTASHQMAIEAARWGGGQAASKRLREANILACGIGLPIAPVEGDTNGLRLGVNELVRWGLTADDMPAVADFIARVLVGNVDVHDVAKEVAEFRSRYRTVNFVRT